MSGEEVFKLSVRTAVYKGGGIGTTTATEMSPGSDLGRERLYTALYQTANACASRHERLAVMDHRGGKAGG